MLPMPYGGSVPASTKCICSWYPADMPYAAQQCSQSSMGWAQLLQGQPEGHVAIGHASQLLSFDIWLGVYAKGVLLCFWLQAKIVAAFD